MKYSQLKQIIAHPKFQEFISKIKPPKTIWGIASVILLFILPEIVAFIYGADIKRFCESQLAHTDDFSKRYLYENIEDLMSEGSWFNLTLGIIFLVWAFY